MFEVTSVFKKQYPSQDGIYNCLENQQEASSHDQKIKDIEKETYSKRAESFKSTDFEKFSERTLKILAPVREIPDGGVILELGGGNGKYAFQLMKEGFNVIESDIAKGSVRRSKEIAEELNVKNGNYAVIDAEDLPFKDQSIDAVFIMAILHHFPNAQKAIQEVHRVLKPDGVFVILREPASWQYYLFFPIYWLLRTVLRRLNKNLYSLADDVTFGFSKRKFNKLLQPLFNNIDYLPVDYSRKVYTNWLILKKKLFRISYKENKSIISVLEKLDQKITKVPVLKNLPWDWDVICKSKKI